MKTILGNFLRLALVAAFLTTLGVGFAQAQFRGFPDCSGRSSLFDNALSVISLTSGGELICFKENNPNFAIPIGTVSGLTGGDTALIGMDFRVQDGNLYGVGNAGGVYRIDRNTAVATFVNSLTVALDGVRFGVDFNPAADRLRIVSNTGQNLRHNVNPMGVTLVDGTLNYAGETAIGIAGAAYTNNDLSAATGTTLYDIDARRNQLVIQNPPNDGTLNVVGSLGINTTRRVGFDIYSTVRGGATANNEGFVSLTLTEDGPSGFCSINLLTGAVFNCTGFNFYQINDIAIPLGQR